MNWIKVDYTKKIFPISPYITNQYIPNNKYWPAHKTQKKYIYPQIQPILATLNSCSYFKTHKKPHKINTTYIYIKFTNPHINLVSMLSMVPVDRSLISLKYLLLHCSYPTTVDELVKVVYKYLINLHENI